MISARLPKISIVTPSLNQGRYIREAVESVIAQGYEEAEHIIVDGGSTDDTTSILRGYSRLNVIVQKGSGEAEAIVKGFSAARGEILGLLEADDLLLPGALRRVADEIRPEQGVLIVAAPSPLVDDAGRPVGYESPWLFASHRRLVKVWAGRTARKSGVFWHRQVWERLGGVCTGDDLTAVLDLYIRFSRRYRFHRVSQPLVACRLHRESKSMRLTEAELMDRTLGVSRRHWGSVWRPGHWGYRLSFLLRALHPMLRASEMYSRGADAARRGRLIAGLLMVLAASVMCPPIFFDRLAAPRLRRRIRSHLGRLRGRPPGPAEAEFEGVYGDGWVGPKLTRDVVVSENTRYLRLKGSSQVELLFRPPLRIRALLSGVPMGDAVTVPRSGEFELCFPTPAGAKPGAHKVTIYASSWLVLRAHGLAPDDRRLSYRFESLDPVSEVGAARP